MADSTVFLTIAQSLAVFDIAMAGEGSATAAFLPGVISHPVPYRLDITPRSLGHVELVESVEKEFQWEKEGGEDIDGIVK